MTRPLLITDCDEVLLHMVAHFGAWLDEAHEIAFEMTGSDFSNALKRRDGSPVSGLEVWPLLDGFFMTEMPRQTLVPGAKEALDALSEVADIAILTNLRDQHQESRAAQLRALGIDYPVFTNQGGKGEPVVRIVDQYRPSVTVFVDDLAVHHASVAKHAPAVWRLHMIAEPVVAAVMPKAEDAHVRIDEWGDAVGWIEGKFNTPTPSPRT
jgi:hypothetical protein